MGRILPVEVKELPEDLAALDRLLSDPALLWPIVERWRREFRRDGRLVLTRGTADDRDGDVRAVDGAQAALPVGVRTLVAEVSDSIHLRRFCRIGMTERVPDESTVRKLTRRIGAETVCGDHARADREGEAGEAVSAARGADRLDRGRGRCEVSDRRGAGVARRQGAGAGGPQAGEADRRERSAVRDRSRAMGRKLRAMTPHDPPPLGGGQGGGAEADRARPGELLERSIKEARRLAALARRRARGRGAKAKLKAAAALEELADRCEKVDRADPPARQRRADHRPARVAVGPRRPPDPQGQARQAQPVPIARLCRDAVRGGGDRPACGRVLRAWDAVGLSA